MSSQGKSLDVRLPRAWDTAAAALAGCARALGDAREVAQIAGASALAFRVSVDERVSLGGPHAYPWREELSAACARLGYWCEVVASPPEAPPGSALHVAAQARARAFIEAGIDAGRPSLLWGVHAPEFGLVRGLDGTGRLLVSGILDGAAPETLESAELGRGDVPVVFALQLTDRLPLSPEEAALAVVRAARSHGVGPTPALAGFHSGLAAWQAIARALESGAIDPAGLSYAAARAAEARAAAADWLDGAPLDLGRANAAFRRSAGMLAELARLHPFPPPPDAMLTDPARDQALALVEEVARAEAEGVHALGAALTRESASSTARLVFVDADASRAADLFACARPLPLDLEREVAECRDRARPRLGEDFRAKLVYDGSRVVAQLLYAPLEKALYPLLADGNRWLVFCPWLAPEMRGRGLGARLFAALEADARAAGVDGLLTLATGDERFLHAAGMMRMGFVEIERRDDTRLLERQLSTTPSNARFTDEPALLAGAAPQRLAVVIRHGFNCPLLLRTRRELARVAQALGDRVALDESDATRHQPAGARIANRSLAHGYVPESSLQAALEDLVEH